MADSDIGSVAGPFLAQAVHLAATAAAASLLILSAAALALFTVPQLPVIINGGPPLPMRSMYASRAYRKGWRRAGQNVRECT